MRTKKRNLYDGMFKIKVFDEGGRAIAKASDRDVSRLEKKARSIFDKLR